MMRIVDKIVDNPLAAPATLEHRDTFPCFGSDCTVVVADRFAAADANGALALAKRRLREWHAQFSRFEADSELSRLNVDPRGTVPVSPLMGRIVQSAVDAARETGGLVDCTLVDAIERVGYAGHFEGAGVGLATLLELAPRRAAGGPRQSADWRAISVDRRSGMVTRPPGLKLDPGGIAKGVFADELGTLLGGFEAFVVDCAGDIRLGGRARTPRRVHVASPFDDSTLHTFELAAGAVATSGIGKRSWLTADGRPAHHLLDPATGEPVFTGVVQATALAPTAAAAEARSKAAILSGPDGAARWLADGGVLLLDDGSCQVTAPPR